MTQNINLATQGTIGKSIIPACVHCGGFTYRKDAHSRKCEKCSGITYIVIEKDMWYCKK